MTEPTPAGPPMVLVPVDVAERAAWPLDDADRVLAQDQVAAAVLEHRRIHAPGFDGVPDLDDPGMVPLPWRQALAAWWALPPRVRFGSPVWHARLIWRNLLARRATRP